LSQQSTVLQPQWRFDWINAFVTASVNAVLAELKIHLGPTLAFDTVNNDYLANVQKATSQISSFPAFHLGDQQLEYLFHLESELWGSLCSHYSYLIGGPLPRHCVLETFKFTHAFFSLERWLRGFSTVSQQKARHYHRNALFDNSGIFTSQFKDCLAALGSPYNLLSSTTSVKPILGQGWTSLSSTPVPNALSAFYRRVSRQRHNHFSSIIESSFKSTRRKLAKHVRARRGTRGLRATWYDVLWIYSESIRYRNLWPSQISASRPFYWNRCVRWCTSLMITGLLELASKSDGTGRIPVLWRRAQLANPILLHVFGSSRDAIS
jgi:hypothetical protein